MAGPVAPSRRPTSRRRAPHVVVLGDLIVDVAARLRGPLVPGSDAPGVVQVRQGGSAANTAIWLVRAGVRASLIGAVGQDIWGRALVRAMRTGGVRVYAPRVALPTARLVALVTSGGERSFVTDRGAADHLAPDALEVRWLRGVDLLHLPAYSLLVDPLMSAALRAVDLARGEGAALSIDLASAGPLRAAGPGTVARRLAELAPDVLFGNAAEAAAMTGGGDGRDLLRLAPVVVVKAGAAGCRVLTRGRSSPAGAGLDMGIPARPRAGAAGTAGAADTTGAGDAFDAGFLAVWAGLAAADRSSQEGLRRAARAGHRAAARLLTTPRPELLVGG